MPVFAKLSHAECNAVHIAREYAPDAARKAMKREVFSRAKVAYGIPANHKLVAEMDVQSPDAGLLRNRDTRETYELNEMGKWVGATNGATDNKRWFQLPVDELADAIGEALDSRDANGQPITQQPNKPNGRHPNPHHEHIVIAEDGSIWVQLDADAYEENTEAHEDESPY